MAQVTDYTIQDGDGLTVLNDLTETFAAVRDDNSGGTAPPNPVPWMRWRDTSVSPPVLRIRNAANSAWTEFKAEIGGTTVGIDLFTAASALAARNIVGAPPQATSSTGVGQWRGIQSLVGGALVLPAGGTWAYFWVAVDVVAEATVNAGASVAAGGAGVEPGVTNTIYRGFAWRIA